MALWIPPNVEHWMRYGSNNEMLYVDVPQGEAERIGAQCRILAMTPLLSALIAETIARQRLGPRARPQRGRFTISCVMSSSRRRRYHSRLRCRRTIAFAVSPKRH